jgi:hypothetical protein
MAAGRSAGRKKNDRLLAGRKRMSGREKNEIQNTFVETPATAISTGSGDRHETCMNTVSEIQKFAGKLNEHSFRNS